MEFDREELVIREALSRMKTPAFQGVGKRPRPARKRRLGVILTAACLCLLLSFGALAAGGTSLETLGWNILHLLQPVQKSCQDNGIEMRVLGAMNDGEMLVLYLTMRDLTDQNRIDESLDIYDYSVSGVHAANCQLTGFDEETGTATLRLQGNGGSGLDGRKLSVGITSFLTGRIKLETVDTGLPLPEPAQAETLPLDLNNVPSRSGFLREEEGTLPMLSPAMSHAIPGADFVEISGAGYVDGLLHIQLHWIGDGLDDHGSVYLVDGEGTPLSLPTGSTSFGMSGRELCYGREYNEYLFDVSGVDLENCRLAADLYTNENSVEGDWRVTFPLQSVSETVELACDLGLDGWTAESIAVSPLGVTLTGRVQGETVAPEVTICLDGGQELGGFSVRTWEEAGRITVKYVPDRPLEPAQIEKILIHGEAFSIK